MDWQLWSPFQSASVKQICEHLTAAERSAAMQRSGLYGVWVGTTFAIPTVAIVLACMRLQGPALIAVVGIALALMLVHVCCIPVWLGMQRRFLCSTQWAREQGLQPVDLRLFASRASRTAVG